MLTYRSLAPQVRERLGRGNAAVAFMRLGNAEDARVASEQIGTEHRFVVAQLTDTVGSSVTDTAGDAYTSTVGSASSVALSTSSSRGSGRSGGRGLSWPGGIPVRAADDLLARGDQLLEPGSVTPLPSPRGSPPGTAWGRQTTPAAGITASAGRTAQRSREFLVEQHALQQLPPSAMIVSYASAAGRRVVLADANPGILGLPTATLRTWDEAGSMTAAVAAGPVAGMVAGMAGGSGPGDSGVMGAPGTARARPPVPWAGPALAAPPGMSAAAGPARRPSGAPSWAGPVPPLTRDPAHAPLSWREDDGAPPA